MFSCLCVCFPSPVYHHITFGPLLEQRVLGARHMLLSRALSLSLLDCRGGFHCFGLMFCRRQASSTGLSSRQACGCPITGGPPGVVNCYVVHARHSVAKWGIMKGCGYLTLVDKHASSHVIDTFMYSVVQNKCVQHWPSSWCCSSWCCGMGLCLCCREIAIVILYKLLSPLARCTWAAALV
jgi:hypothetical protein